MLKNVREKVPYTEVERDSLNDFQIVRFGHRPAGSLQRQLGESPGLDQLPALALQPATSAW
jgi:hypothetical protein